MAEPFSIATGAIQVAGAGIQLARVLFGYLESVKHAEKNMRAIAVEVRLTSSVLEHLGGFLKDEGETICSEDLVKDAKATFFGCENAFNEVSATFSGLVNAGNDIATRISLVRRISWPLRKGKLDALQANLERLKLTLLLMLSVLGYARDNAIRSDVRDSRIAIERLQIDNLMRAKANATERYESLTTGSPDHRMIPRIQTTSWSDAIKSVNVDRSVLGTSTRAVTSGTSLEDNKEESSRSDTDQGSFATSPPNSADLLLRLNECSAAILRLTSTINTAFLNLSAAQSFDVGTFTDRYQALKTRVEEFLAVYMKQQTSDDGSPIVQPSGSAQYIEPNYPQLRPEHRSRQTSSESVTKYVPESYGGPPADQPPPAQGYFDGARPRGPSFGTQTGDIPPDSNAYAPPPGAYTPNAPAPASYTPNQLHPSYTPNGPPRPAYSPEVDRAGYIKPPPHARRPSHSSMHSERSHYSHPSRKSYGSRRSSDSETHRPTWEDSIYELFGQIRDVFIWGFVRPDKWWPYSGLRREVENEDIRGVEEQYSLGSVDELVRRWTTVEM